MYTSDKEKGVDLRKPALVYLIGSVFLLVFGLIYEAFSHGVYSAWMVCAFLAPLLGGTLVFLLLDLFSPLRRSFPKKAMNLYHCGIMTLSVGSVFRGVLEIYGTTNRLGVVYWLAGGALVAAGAAGIFLSCLSGRRMVQ